MHDLHLADKVIKQILEFADKNNFKKITKVFIKIGVISEHGQEITEENLVFNLKLLSAGTKADGAIFDITKTIGDGRYVIDEIEGE